MALLTGMTEDGREVPVQVDSTGRLVAEGLQGPKGDKGLDALDVWQRNGADVFLKDAAYNMGIGTDSPTEKLHVAGVIKAGDGYSSDGTVLIEGNYIADACLAVVGTERSSGGPMLGACVKPSHLAQDEFLSTYAQGAERGAYVISGNVHKWYCGNQQAAAIGSAVLISELMRLTAAGELQLGETLPGSAQFRVNRVGYINSEGLRHRIAENNDAAKAAGMVPGDFYRKADGTLMIAF
jgi:hypothetical protein